MSAPGTISRTATVPWWVDRAIRDTTPMRNHFAVGGIGSAKSHGGQIWDIQRCLLNGTHLKDPKPTISWTVAPNYRICETLLNLTLDVALNVFGMKEGVHYNLYRSFPRRIDFSPIGKKHHMMFLSASNPEHFVSESITHWRWSEVGVSKPDVFEKLTDRRRDKRGKVLQGLAEGSPEGFNHYYDWAGFVGWNRDAIDTKRNYRAFRLETRDNLKHLAPGYLEGLEAQYAYSPELVLSYTKGIFTNIKRSSAYWEWYESRNVTSGVEPTPHIPVNLTFDFNVSPLAIVALQERVSQKHYDAPREKKLIALWESSGESRGLMDGVAEFAAAFPPHQYGNTAINVYGDASGWARNLHSATSSYTEIDNYLRALSYRNVNLLAFRANPTIRDRLEKTAALMAYERLLVDSRCRNLIASFSKTTLKEGTYEIDKPKDDRHSHWADAATYAAFQLAKDIDLARPSTRRAYGA